MRRIFAVCGLAVFIVMGVVAPTAAQSRSVFWQQWDVTIDNVNVTTNRFDVTELYDIQFSGTFQFGSAVIPFENLERIENVQVSQAGSALRESCSGNRGTFCTENTDEGLSITYYFEQPITNDSEQFEIEYTVIGALRVYEGGDQLWWTAIPTEHFGFPIGSSTVTVQLPSGYAPREGVDPVETYGAPAQVDVRGTTVIATASGLSGSDYLEIRAQFPHNPNARIPSWQATFDQQRLYEETTKPLVDLGVIALSLLIAIGGLMALYALWYTRGRDPKVGIVPEYLSEPPSNLPPAIVGTLLDEQADLRDVMSTIIDLARRGYIVMEESQEDGLFGIGKVSKFVFKRTDKEVTDLRAFEKRMINGIFAGGQMERTLESLTNKFYTYIPQLQNDLYQAMVTEELFTTKPSTTRSMWSGLGVVLLVVAFGFGFFGISLVENVSSAILCLPVSVGLVGFVAMIVGRHMPAKTKKGAEEAAKWNAFREYLRNLDKYDNVEAAAKHFDDYLAYAIAFGIDRLWVRKFTQLQTVPIPTWYYPTYLGGPYRRGYVSGTPVHFPQSGGLNPGELARAGEGGFSLDDVSGKISGGLENISDGLTNMLNSASRAMTSRPQQSSGSSGRWSSGGRSWSGGGFSGGGSSGGGSRGFG
jgi:uncharacterized membrane protein